jgi:hypothetical protein
MSELYYSLRINTTDRIVSIIGPGSKPWANPTFYQEDNLAMRLYFVSLASTGTTPPTYTKADPTGWTVELRIGSLEGQVLASQGTWAVVDGGATEGKYLSGMINLNTEATVEAMVARQTINRYLEVEVSDGTSFYTATQTSVAIKPEVITDGAPDAVGVQAGPGLLSGLGTPEGAVIGNPGWRYWDRQNKIDYVKDSGTGTNTGWRELLA